MRTQIALLLVLFQAFVVACSKEDDVGNNSNTAGTAAGTLPVAGAAGLAGAAGTAGVAGTAAVAGTGVAGTGTAGTAGMAGAAGMTGMDLPMLAPADYSLDTNWLCRPGLADDKCKAELSVTEVLADGTRTMTSLEPAAADAPIDCFYIYPTVDQDMTPDNKDFAAIDRTLILDPLLSQITLLRTHCNIYAPLYRQASIGSYYLNTFEEIDERLDIAFADVQAAFNYYLQNLDSGKPLILAGHSQGTMMATKLIKAVIDNDPALRQKLLTALLIGAVGYFHVPEGALAGDSFQNVPLCSSNEENGCVVAWNSFGDGYAPGSLYGYLGRPPMAGTSLGCMHPATTAGAKAPLAGVWLPTMGRQPIWQFPYVFGDTPITTDFAVYRGLFSAECAIADNSQPYLKIIPEPMMDDVRVNPVPFDFEGLSPDILGLHVIDWSFAIDDLRTLIETKLAARQ